MLKNEFTTPLEVEDLGNSLRRITAPLHYFDPWGREIIVPVGFITDFASVPALARCGVVALLLCRLLRSVLYHPAWLIALYAAEALAYFVIFVAEWLEDTTTDAIAAVHDWLYATRRFPKPVADWILFKGMRAKNAPRSALLKRLLFLDAVGVGGWFAWWGDARRRHNLAAKAHAYTEAGAGGRT